MRIGRLCERGRERGRKRTVERRGSWKSGNGGGVDVAIEGLFEVLDVLRRVKQRRERVLGFEAVQKRVHQFCRSGETQIRTYNVAGRNRSE